MTRREKHGGNLKDSPPTRPGSHGDVETDSDGREGEPNTYTQKMTVSDKQREGRAHTQSQVDKERAHAKSERLGGTRRHTERRHWQLEQPEGKGPAPHMQTRFTSDAGIKINVDDSAADTCMRQHHCQPEWH